MSDGIDIRRNSHLERIADALEGILKEIKQKAPNNVSTSNVHGLCSVCGQPRYKCSGDFNGKH
jgi:hypothetical protein